MKGTLCTERNRTTILYDTHCKMKTYANYAISCHCGAICKTCGVLPFYIPRSNPDGFGVTLACVDWGEDGAPAVEVRFYDGVNWERSHAETGIAEQTAARKR